MQRQRESWDDLTIFQKMEVMQGLASYPAMTAMLFLRRGLGHRFLSPVGIFLTVFAMFVIAEYARDTHYYDALQVFAGLMLLCGLAERSQRLKEIKRGQWQHTRYIGDSRLAFRWVPEWLKRNRRVERFIDPLVWIALGVGAYQFSPVLGGWMVFSGLCLRVFEAAVHQRDQERDMDTFDALVEAQVQSDTVERLTTPPPEAPSQIVESGTVPTGLGADIEQQVKDRQARRKAAAARKEKMAAQMDVPKQDREPNPGLPESMPLTRSDKFWRFMWGKRIWNRWQRRHEK